MSSNPYRFSQPLSSQFRLNTGRNARLERVRRALRDFNTPDESSWQIIPTGQNSSTVVQFADGSRVLISYETAVALRTRDGLFFATPYGECSRVTDRAIASFTGNPARLSFDQLHVELRNLFLTL